MGPSRRRRGPPDRYDASARSLRRILFALVGLVVVLLVGTVGYVLLGFTLLEAAYQTVTTVATVGFREVHPLGPVGQVFTMVLIILGAGIVLYNLGLLVEAFAEGHLRDHLERRRMDRDIGRMSGHVIICGYGRVGRAAADHLQAIGHDVVVVERDAERLAGLGTPHLVGDATADDVLVEAGIDRARALVATLDTDAETVYLVLSARALSPTLTIVARARTADSKHKLLLAGATRAVNPQSIGGRRLASWALQPDVAEFLDVATTDDEEGFWIRQVTVAPGSTADGSCLGALDLARTGAQLLALRRDRAEPFRATPAPETELAAGAVLIALGSTDQLDALEALVTD